MIVKLDNLVLMEKQQKLDKDNKTVYEFVCFQKGYKNLITVKDIPYDLFVDLEESCKLSFDCKMIVWGNNNSYGASFRFLGMN